MSAFKNKKTSVVWDVFKAIDKDFAKCNMCSAKLSYRTTITNLRKHIRCKHPTVDLERTTPFRNNSVRKIDYLIDDDMDDEETYLQYPKLYQGSPEETRRTKSIDAEEHHEEDADGRASLFDIKTKNETNTIIFEHIDPTHNRSVQQNMQSSDTVINSTQNSARRTIAATKYSHDIEAFGEHIKAEMNKITNEELRDEAMQAVNTILFEFKKKQRLAYAEE